MQPLIGVAERTRVQVEPDERQVGGGRVWSLGRPFQRSGERLPRIAVSAGGQVEAPEQQRRAGIVRMPGVAGKRRQDRLRAVQFTQLQRHARQGESMLQGRRLAGFQQELRVLQAAAQLRVPHGFQVGRAGRPNAKSRREHQGKQPPHPYRDAAVRHPVLPEEAQDCREAPSPLVSAVGRRPYIRDFRPRMNR